MEDRVKIINGVMVKDITPELTGEEQKTRIKEVAEGLIAFNKNRRASTSRQ